MCIRDRQLRDRKEKYEGYKDRLEKTAENEISTTDPDARLMSNNNNSVDVSYNVQTSVDAKNKMIVDFKVIQKPNDLGQLASICLLYTSGHNKIPFPCIMAHDVHVSTEFLSAF